MTFIRGQKVRIIGGGIFDRKNIGKTGTYIGLHQRYPECSIVVVDGGVNGYTAYNDRFNINGYDYGYTSELEPVVDDTSLIERVYNSMLSDMQNAILQQTNQPTKKTLMRKLSELSATIRRAFSPDQKALWRTGRIDDAGKPTQQAIQEALQELALAYIKEHQADFVAAAKEELEIEEQEKE